MALRARKHTRESPPRPVKRVRRVEAALKSELASDEREQLTAHLRFVEQKLEEQSTMRERLVLELDVSRDEVRMGRGESELAIERMTTALQVMYNVMTNDLLSNDLLKEGPSPLLPRSSGARRIARSPLHPASLMVVQQRKRVRC
jgi:hypothetical protein